MRWLSRENGGKGEQQRIEREPSATGTVHNSVRLGKEFKWEGASYQSQSVKETRRDWELGTKVLDLYSQWTVAGGACPLGRPLWLRCGEWTAGAKM